LWPSDLIVAYIKFFSVAPHARFFHNALPDRPLGLEHASFRLFRGSLGRWLTHGLIQTKSPRWQKFFYSWLQTKRGCAPMDETDIVGAFKKHKKALTHPPESEFPEEFQFRAQVCLDELLQKANFEIPRSVEYEMSHNACNTYGRAQGGQIQAVQAAFATILPTDRDIYRVSQYITKPENPVGHEFFASIFDSEDYQFGNQLYDQGDLADIMLSFLDDRIVQRPHSEIFGLDNRGKIVVGGWLGVPTPIDSVRKVNSHEDSERAIKTFPMIDMTLLVSAATHACNDTVKVAPILEPLKVRLVSKGDPLTYAASMPMQKQMHSFLKRKPQFSLIGKPVEPANFEFLSQHRTSRLIANDPRCPGEWVWNSGDYSAATDGLDIRFTKQIFETLLTKIDDSDASIVQTWKQVLRHVLYEQTLEYPGKPSQIRKDGLLPGRQQNGQLMGSTLSFPVLCIANLVCYWLALEDYINELNYYKWERSTSKRKKPFQRRHLRFSELAVLINGDDILFMMNKFLRTFWLRRIEEVGFKLSPGKSLEHEFLATVNSQQWRFLCKDRLEPATGVWDYIPYFTVGLLVEGSAAKVKSSDPVHDLGAAWNAIRPTSFSQIQALSRFLSLHRDEIRHTTKDGLLNLFASNQNYGLGWELPIALPGEQAWEYHWTRLQRYIAHRYNLRNLGKIGVKPSRGAIEVVYKTFDGREYPYTYPNQDESEVSDLYLAVPKQEEPAVPSEWSYEYELIPEQKSRQNCSPDRFNFFEKYSGEGLSVHKKWCHPRIKGWRKILRNQASWPDQLLAKGSEMQMEIDYLPVRHRVDGLRALGKPDVSNE